jgi:hypothetical protein
MDRVISAPWVSIGLFMGMLVAFWIGRRVRGAPSEESAFSGINGAVFGLFSLLIAFTFSGAAARLDQHREMIGEEASSIDTAYLRLDLLPSAAQPALRVLFRRYVDSRIAVYAKLPDIDAAQQELQAASQLQLQIWQGAVAATRLPDVHPDGAKLIVPAINQMTGLASTRNLRAQLHPPLAIAVMLFLLGLASAFLFGMSLGTAGTLSRVHIVGYAAIVSLMIFLIADLEYPNYGLIRSYAFDQMLVDLRQGMNDGR